MYTKVSYFKTNIHGEITLLYQAFVFVSSLSQIKNFINTNN